MFKDYYADLLEQDIKTLNAKFTEVFDLATPFDNWSVGAAGQIYGLIDFHEISPSEGRADDVRTGFQLKDLALEVSLVAIAPGRLEATAIGAGLMLRLENGIKQVQARAACELQIIDNLTIRGQIVSRKDQSPKPPRPWAVQVAASGTATIAIYRNARGEAVEPPAKYIREAAPQSEKDSLYIKTLRKYNASHP